MKYNSEKHHRRSLRLKNYDYAHPGAYFVTICAHNRECLFGDIVDGEMELNVFGKIADVYLNDIPGHFNNVSLDEYIIMRITFIK